MVPTGYGLDVTLLCGAGGHDIIFNRYFTVTGVDLSTGMLHKARLAHPDIEYLEGNMRTVRLNRQLDAVAIPDSIDYMASEDDLRQAIQTAAVHLNPGGVLLVVAKTAETFRNNNFACTGAKDGVPVTLFGNNYINPFRPHTYEAALVYLIRRQRDLTIHTDHHVLFPQPTWERVFTDAGFIMQQTILPGSYDNYLLGEG